MKKKLSNPTYQAFCENIRFSSFSRPIVKMVIFAASQLFQFSLLERALYYETGLEDFLNVQFTSFFCLTVVTLNMTLNKSFTPFDPLSSLINVSLQGDHGVRYLPINYASEYNCEKYIQYWEKYIKFIGSIEGDHH